MNSRTLGFLLAIVLSVLKAPGFAQDQDIIDSLTRLAEGNAEVRYRAMHALALEYADHDNEKALSYVVAAERASAGVSDSGFLLRNISVKGQILRRLGRFEDALSIMHAALNDPGFRRYEHETPRLLQTIGLIHLYRSEIDVALDHFFKALERAENVQDSTSLASLTGNIGIVYYRLSDYRRAIVFLERCYEMVEKGSQSSCGVLINLSLCYLNLDDIDMAGRYVNEVIDRCDGMPLASQIHVGYLQGYYYLRRKEYGRAEEKFLWSLDAARSLENRRMEMDNLFMLAEISIQNEDWKVARHYLQMGAQLIEHGTEYNKEMMTLYRMLGSLYLGEGNYRKASSWQSKYIALRDSIYDDALTSGLMKVEADFMSRAARKQVAMQEKLLQSKDETLQKQRVLNAALVLAGGLIVCILGLVYRDWKRDRAMKELLAERVVDRTREMRCRELEVGTQLHEQEILTRRVVEEVQAISQRIVGLCMVGDLDIQSERGQAYFREIRHQSEMIPEIAKRLKEGTNNSNIHE